MNDAIKELLIELTKEYGLLVIFFIIIILITVYFLGKIFLKMAPEGGLKVFPAVKHYVRKKIRKRLRTHRIFKKFDEWIHNDIPNMNIRGANEGRNDMYKYCMAAKFQVYHKAVIALLEEPELLDKAKDRAWFKRRLERVITDGIKKYSWEWKDNNVPEVFITKFNDVWHKATIDMCLDNIREISLDHNLTEGMILEDILDMLVLAFSRTLRDARTTLIEINGELSKYQFGGKDL